MFTVFIFVLLVGLTLVLLLLWAVTWKKAFGKAIVIIWGCVIGLAVIFDLLPKAKSKIILSRNDFYGQYIVDRSFFPGAQVNWQYNHFRFEIRPNDSIYFYITDHARILNTDTGNIATVRPYRSERLVVHMPQPAHHIFTSNPTVYRNTARFYLVFHSPKFGNVFFTKGQWAAIDK